MTKNTGIQYEELVQHIFEQILNQNSVNTIDVQHNVILQGIKIDHQIDIYWELEVGGFEYSTVVQAKDWNQPVNQGELIKFKGVLDDLPRQHTGIFVTKKGYQSGAKKYAESSGIHLYELREASEEDLAGRIKTINISLVGYTPHSTDINLVLDDEWSKNEMTRLNIAPDDGFALEICGMPDELVFTDITGKRLIDAQEVIDSFYPTQWQEIAPTTKTYEFDRDAFISTNNPRFPKVKVSAMQATISMSRTDDRIQIVGEDIVHFILRKLVDDSERLFDEDGNLIR